MTSNYPQPLAIPPLRSHRQTFIILHGRGSSASKFGPDILSSAVSLPQDDSHLQCTLSSAFPYAKFVFPTALRSRATVYKRSIINQWFDSWTLDASSQEQGGKEHEYPQVDGLRETCVYIHELLRQEISLIGGDAKNVVLGGLSQGCAAALVSLLLWDGDPLGAAFGMCGWLPFRKQMKNAVQRLDSDDDGIIDGEEFNPFEDSSEDVDDSENLNTDVTETPSARAAVCLKEELEMIFPTTTSSMKLPFQSIPLFLGHGMEDAKVPVRFGKDAASFLKTIDMKVSWNEYRNLDHWYSENMLGDLVVFLRETANFKIADLKEDDN